MSAPAGLGRKAADVWSDVTSKYDLRSDELRVLEDACREMDLIDTMVEALAGAELIVKGSMGQPTMSPLVSEIRQHRTVLAGLLRGLKLPDDADSKPDTSQQRAAGVAKWQSKRGA